MRAASSVILAAVLATAAPAAGALADDDWPADCPKPKYSWFPGNWPAERALARIGCGLRRQSASGEAATAAANPARYTGYAPPPPVGADASTEQPPVVDMLGVDTLGAGSRAADRCSEAPESAMAAVIVPLELALCALSAPWRSETAPPAEPPAAGPDLSAVQPIAPVASAEPDPAMR